MSFSLKKLSALFCLRKRSAFINFRIFFAFRLLSFEFVIEERKYFGDFYLKS